MTRFYSDRDVQRQLEKILNGGIEFQDNMRGGFVEIVTSNGVETIQHNLGYVPIGWIEVYRTGAVTLTAETPSLWTNQEMFLRSNALNETVRIFVL